MFLVFQLSQWTWSSSHGHNMDGDYKQKGCIKGTKLMQALPGCLPIQASPSDKSIKPRWAPVL